MGLCFGTLHIAICGRDRVIVCSDSRGHSDSGPKGDDFEKLFRAGRRTLCGIGGVLMLGPDSYVSNRIVKLCADEKLEDHPRKLLLAIASDMQGAIAELFMEHPLPDLPFAFSAFSIQRTSTGQIDLLDLEFPIVRDSAGRRLGTPAVRTHIEGRVPPGPFVYHIGRGDCLTKGPERKLDPNASDDILLRGIDNIFAGVQAENESCRDEVGGPIDIATIDSTGFHWLRKKPIWT
jgi:hypothetical protein